MSRPTGRPPGRPARPLLERLSEQIVRVADGDCWLWTGLTDIDGYGIIGEGGNNCRSLRVHRVVYQMAVGPIPEGMVIDHLCRVRNCANPAHLEVVTPAENTRRSNAVRPLPTHCIRGHAFDARNTYITKEGHRRCRVCKAAHERERQRRLRQEVAA